MPETMETVWFTREFSCIFVTWWDYVGFCLILGRWDSLLKNLFTCGWFGTFIIFPYIVNNLIIIISCSFIFFRGVGQPPTSIHMCFCFLFWLDFLFLLIRMPTGPEASTMPCGNLKSLPNDSFLRGRAGCVSTSLGRLGAQRSFDAHRSGTGRCHS